MDNQLAQHPATPEEIWAMLRELTKRQEESSEEADRRHKKADQRHKKAERRHKKADKKAKRRHKKADKKAERQMEELREQMKDTDRRLKKTDELFNSQWGKLVESLVEGDLVPLLRERGIEVLSTHRRVDGRRNGDHYEFDILAINGEEVVVVEVKTTLRSGDVTHFLGKLTRFTEYEPVWKGKRIFGSVAYLEADTSVQVYAQRRGLFVIRATGSSASIINQADFKPRVFS